MGPSVAPEPSYATEGALYMYNWADYINPDNIKEVPEAVQHHRLDVRHLCRQRGADDPAPGRRHGPLRHRRPDREFVPAMADQAFIEKLDFSRIPNAQYINAAVQEVLRPEWGVGQVQRLPHAQGLGHDRHRPPRSKFVKEDITTWKQFFEVAPKYKGQIVVVKSAGDVLWPRSRRSATR